MPGGLVVRFVKVADFEAVSRLLVELGRPAPTEETRVDFRTTFARHVASSETASLIAERDGVPVGLLVLQFRDRLNWPTPEAWIPDLIVTTRLHGMGVATGIDLDRLWEAGQVAEAIVGRELPGKVHKAGVRSLRR